MVVENYGQGGTSGRRPNRSEVTAGGADRKRESIPKMVPFLSRRSVVVLAIGLIVGIFGGLLYYFISPSLNSAGPVAPQDTTPAIWGSYKGPYESTVQVQIVNPGSSYTSLTDLQRTAEYYAAKANTFPFLDFLAQELEESAPTFAHTAEELNQMISIRYNSNSDVPLIEIQTIGASMEETLYLTAFVPTVFKDFLAAEEDKLRLEEYDSLVEDAGNVRAKLLEAEQELAYASLQGTTHDLYSDSTYISLAAKVEALNTELVRQAEELAALIAIGDQSQDYLDALAAVERASSALAEARSELTTLQNQNEIDYVGHNLDLNLAEGRVANLSQELAYLTDRMTSLLSGNGDDPSVLEEMVVGKPSEPVPSIDRIRGRDAMLLGGIIGVGVAWITVNFKWVIKGMPSTNVRRREEEEENEETA